MTSRILGKLSRPTAHRDIDNAPDGWVSSVKAPTRNDAQNRRMWAVLTDISKQVNWHGNRLMQEEWKDVFTAALKRQNVVPGIDGGFVVIGARTSKMTRPEMSELQELMGAFGVEKSVQWSDENGQTN